jgi:U3 small nucleolar RNA-associated protein 14
LEKRAEHVLPGSKEGGGQGREMVQTMYTHINKWINNKKINKDKDKNFTCFKFIFYIPK